MVHIDMVHIHMDPAVSRPWVPTMEWSPDVIDLRRFVLGPIFMDDVAAEQTASVCRRRRMHHVE
jgi:hypothetical protein